MCEDLFGSLTSIFFPPLAGGRSGRPVVRSSGHPSSSDTRKQETGIFHKNANNHVSHYILVHQCYWSRCNIRKLDLWR